MTNSKVNIRFAKDGDRQNILSLLNHVFLENQRSSVKRGDEYWQWKFNNNIFGDSILTIAEDNNEIIGIDHLWTWNLQSRGVTINACQPCDSAVKSEYRGMGIFKQLRLSGIGEAIKRGHQLLFNFPNKNSLPANLKIGAQHLGKITWWVKVLRPIKMTMGALGNDLSYATDIDKEFKLDTGILDTVSNEYQNFDQFITINRKDGFHEWRYQNRPNRQYGMIRFNRAGKRICGIFTLNQKGVIREMVLVDVVGETNLSGYLFEEAVKIARYQDATFLALMNNDKFETEQLWRKGFFKKKMKNMVVLPIDLGIESKVTNIGNWALVAGMHDSI